MTFWKWVWFQLWWRMAAYPALLFLASEINPDAPTPWVMCPACGGTWFRVLAVIERGRWSEDGERYEEAAPRVTSYVKGDHGEALWCHDCGHKFDLPRDEGQP